MTSETAVAATRHVHDLLRFERNVPTDHRSCYNELTSTSYSLLARGGTALQAERSRVRFPLVSLESFLPSLLWPWGSTQPLTEMSTTNISWWVKAAGT